MMRTRFRAHRLGCAFACLAAAAYARQDDLNARDAFWSASDLVGKRPANLTAHKSATSTSTASTTKPSTSQASKPQPSVTVLNPDSSQPGSADAQHAPLGLRYSVLKQKSDGTFEEISPDAVFHAGDRIRLSVMSNQEGYLYIIEHGTSGKWRPLYPPPGGTESKLAPGTEYLIPGGKDEFFQFSGDPGDEKLFVMLTRMPETNLDQTIEALRNHQATGINDQVVARLRQEVQTRDLVFTKSDDNQPSSGDASGADKATYVVNKATSKTPDPHIVVDVVLSHR
jgi:Domain of unknown function (DUF4384)